MKTKMNHFVEQNNQALRDRLEKLLVRLEMIDDELTVRWSETKWRERNLVAHSIEVAEQRIAGTWMPENEAEVYEFANQNLI